jgi:hypothetical protein
MATIFLTSDDIVRVTGRTLVTVQNWRAYGLETTKRGAPKSKLPCVTKKVGARHRVFFKKDVFVKWAALHGIKCNWKAL